MEKLQHFIIIFACAVKLVVFSVLIRTKLVDILILKLYPGIEGSVTEFDFPTVSPFNFRKRRIICRPETERNQIVRKNACLKVN